MAGLVRTNGGLDGTSTNHILTDSGRLGDSNLDVRSGEQVDAQAYLAAAWALATMAVRQGVTDLSPTSQVDAELPGLRVGTPDIPRNLPEGDGVLNLRSLVCSAEFTWPCDEAIRIFTCESGLNPMAYNPSGSYGLTQIQAYWHLDKLERVTGSRDPALLFDAEINLRVAWIIYEDQGWSPWSCY